MPNKTRTLQGIYKAAFTI